MRHTFNYKTAFRILKGGNISMVVSAFLAGATMSYAAPATNALPTNGNVVSGNVNISTNSNVMNINQTTNKSIINWNTYNIGSSATVNYNFTQNNSSSLNRVLSNNPSEIYGKLNANGKVILVNPNGVIFGRGSSVNVGSLVATTMNIKDGDYLNDTLLFQRENVIGTILNEGTITADEKGYIALLSPKVLNDGIIRAIKGTVSLVAGEKIELTLDSSGLKTIIVEPSTIQTLIENKSLVEADGGLIYIGAKQAEQLLDTAMNIKNSGTLQANSMDELLGKVTLDGDHIEVSGTIEAKDGEVYVGHKDVEKTLIKSTASLEADFVETSGKVLKVEDGVKIKAKEWLLDPTDLTIAASGGDISASTLQGQLASGNIELQADNDINVNEVLTWGANTLTLTAGHDINVNKVIDITGSGNITLNYVNRLRMKQGSDGLSFDGKINFSPTSTATTMMINSESFKLIKSLDTWNSANDTTSGYGLKCALTTDLDAQETPLSSINLWKFEGLGHVISNLKYTTSFVESDNQTSLFRGQTLRRDSLYEVDPLSFDMKLTNLGVVNLVSNITDNSGSSNGGVGGLVSSTQYNGDTTTASSLLLFNVFTQGSITSGALRTGGLVGNFAGSKLTIDESHSLTNITGTNNRIGGLFGAGVGVVVKNSYVKADIIGSGANAAYVGGLGGIASSADVQDSYVIGNITAETASSGNIGGFFGQLGRGMAPNYTGASYNNVSDTISNSYYAGKVTGYTKVGGIIGEAWTDASTFTITLDNVQAYGEVIGTSTLTTSVGGYIGGLVGRLAQDTSSTLMLNDSNAYNTTKKGSTLATYDFGPGAGPDLLGTLVGNTGEYYSTTHTGVTVNNSSHGTKSFSYFELSNLSMESGQLETSDLTPIFSGETPVLGTHYKIQILSGDTVIYDSTTNGSSGLTTLGEGSYTVKLVDLNTDAFKLVGFNNIANLTVTPSTSSNTDTSSNETPSTPNTDDSTSNETPSTPNTDDSTSNETPSTPNTDDSTSNNSNEELQTTAIKLTERLVDNIVKIFENGQKEMLKESQDIQYKELAKELNSNQSNSNVEAMNNNQMSDQNEKKENGLSLDDGKSLLTSTMLLDANPFVTNDQIDVQNGGINNDESALKSETVSSSEEQKSESSSTQDITNSTNISVVPNENRVIAKVDLQKSNSFSFTIKEAVAIKMEPKEITDVKATLAGGQTLPNWLKFDKATQTFLAVNPPVGSLPLETKVTVTGGAKTEVISVEITK